MFVDGKPTGQTCPTERIGCEVGPHTVEVYDVVTETRRKWDINVKDTRLSYPRPRRRRPVLPLLDRRLAA